VDHPLAVNPDRARRRRRARAALAVSVLLLATDGAAPAGEGPPGLRELVREGNAARQSGRIDDALAAYQKARALAPESYEVRVLLADTLRRVGRAAEASAQYTQAAALDPSRPEAYSGQAQLLRRAFDDAGAAALLEGALLKVAPGARTDLLLNLGETRRRQGRSAEAERIFREVVGARPGGAPGQAGLASVAEDRGDLAGALEAWDSYLKLRPEDEAAALRREELREIRVSIAALRAAASAAPGAGIFAELGRLLAVAGDAAGAAEACRRALAIDRAHLDARRGLALALRGLGDARGAAEQFRLLLAGAPADAVALYSIVDLARERGDARAEGAAWRALLAARPDELPAARAFIAFLESSGDEGALAKEIDRLGKAVRGGAGGGEAAGVPGLRLRAMLLAAAGGSEEAARALYGALRADPTDPWTVEVATEILATRPPLLPALGDLARAEAERAEAGPAGGEAARQVLRARLVWWAGRGGEALNLMQRAVADHPESGVARSALALGLKEIAGKQALALRELERATALDPSRIADHVDLAIALLRAGKAGQAEAAARRGLAARPGAAPALSVLGAALAEQGDLEGSAAAYAAALRADPVDYLGLARGQYPLTLAALGRHAEARRALRGEVPPIPDILYREAWAFARDACRDRRYNGQDWEAWRDRYRGRLRTPQEAHRAIAEMLASLGDPYTRLRDPDETAAVFLARRGASAGVDRFGRNRPHSRTVIAEERPGGLGYIRLSNLADPNVIEEVRKALLELRDKEGIILDLRGNPGGFSRAADAVGDLLVGPGKEAGIDMGPAGPELQVTGGEGAVTDSPLVVLVDGQTGSAAERLARTLESTGRASLVGDATRGKGLAQSSRVLPGGTTVLVSVGEMLGPDGQPLQGRGLKPRQPAPKPDAIPPPPPAPPEP
jgi:tetratricopeptide (TPR) repeat protein